MKLMSLLLGLGIGAIGTAVFYAYSFDKSEYDWVAPQSVRAEITESTTTLGRMTDELLKNIETWTGVEIDFVKGSLTELTGSAKAEDDHAHNEASHKDDDHSAGKEHGHNEEGHKDDDHGDEKEHDHSEEGHKDDDHGDEKEHGQSEEGHKDDDHDDEKEHDHSEEGHKDDDHSAGKEHSHSEEGHKDDDHGDEKEHGHSEEGHKDDDHGDEKEHGHGNDDDDGHAEEDVVRLTASQQKEFGIELGFARVVKLGETINLPGEVKYNGDRVAHVVPRVKGIVSSVSARQGDYVKAGDVLAVLESRELAEIKSQYLASIGRLEIAQATFDREDQLRTEQISTEQSILEAKGAVAEAKIVLRSVRQQLLALGFNEISLKRLRDEPEAPLTPYKLIAPFDGLIINRHITLGETVDDSNEAFVIVDMTDLWVDFQIFPKDLRKVKQGQTVKVLDESGSILTESKITYVAPQVQEETRTGLARLQIPTSASLLRPGMFITASVEVGIEDKIFTIPKTAPQIMNEKTVVFVQEGDGFEAREISLGRTQGNLIEVKGGLDNTTPIVVAGAFVLKAQLSKAQFGDGHNH